MHGVGGKGGGSKKGEMPRKHPLLPLPPLFSVVLFFPVFSPLLSSSSSSSSSSSCADGLGIAPPPQVLSYAEDNVTPPGWLSRDAAVAAALMDRSVLPSGPDNG